VNHAERLRQLADRMGLDGYAEELREIAGEMEAQPPAQAERAPITEFQRGILLIYHMGPDALAGRQMSLIDAFYLGIEAAERHHGIIGEEDRATLKGQQ
jgi:hypothetical protein